MGTSRALFFLCLAFTSLAINAVDVSYDGRAIKIDGKRKILISGSIHYPRSTAEVSIFIYVSSHFYISFAYIINILFINTDHYTIYITIYIKSFS